MPEPTPHNASTVGAHEAKTNLGQLLDRVERGDIIVITRHGEPVARLVPFEERFDRARIVASLDALDALSTRIRARGVALTQSEIKASIEEGRM